MRTTKSLATLLALICLTGMVTAQCNAPGTEDFELVVPTSLSYGIATPVVLPAGWSHDLTAPNSWRADSGGTSSVSTGPSVDHTTGGSTGIYLYTECSGGSAGVEARMRVCFDASTLTTPSIEFWYHMWNGSGVVGNMGTLEINQSTDQGATYTTLLWSQTGDQGDVWKFAGPINVTPDAGTNEVWLQVKGIRGLSYYSDMAIDDFKFGEPTPTDWETNSTAGSVDFNGAEGDAFAPAIVNENGYLCGGGAALSGTFNVSSDVPSGLFEVVLTPAAIVGASGAGSVMLGTEILNLSVLTVGSWSYLNGGATLGLTSMPGSGFPGASGGAFSASWAASANFDISAQGVFTDPTAPSGFVLSQATELHVSLLPAAPSVPGPTSDDSSVSIDVTAAPTCWFASGISFNGTVYTTISVISNGRVMFGPGDTDLSPTALEALTDAPFLGFWTDLNPSAAGTITVSNPTPGVVRADWAGVAYYGQTTTVSYGVQLDDASQIFSIDGLGGLVPNPVTTSGGDSQFLGLSVGAAGGATNAGTTAFAFGGGGAPAAPMTDMLYDYFDYLTGTGGLVPSLATPTVPPLSEVQFNYVAGTGWLWTGL